MTELPALREALRDTAERHTRSRSRRRSRRIIAPLVVAACALAVVLALPQSRPTGPAGETTSTPTPTATTAPVLTRAEQARLELAKTYSVFGRPARASDRVPVNFRGGGRPGRQVDWGQTRRIASGGGVTAYAYPEIERGTVQLCTLLQASAQIGGGGCSPFTQGKARSKMSKVFVHKGGPIYMLLLPDGVASVSVDLGDGRTVTRRVQENGFVYQGHGVRRFSWKDAGGVEHTTGASI
jgi:hypothetical protein